MGPHAFYSAADLAHVAATDHIGGGVLTPPAGACRLGITIALDAAKKVQAKVKGSTTAVGFNGNANVTVAAWNNFELNVVPGDTVDLFLDGNATILYVSLTWFYDPPS